MKRIDVLNQISELSAKRDMWMLKLEEVQVPSIRKAIQEELEIIDEKAYELALKLKEIREKESRKSV